MILKRKILNLSVTDDKVFIVEAAKEIVDNINKHKKEEEKKVSLSAFILNSLKDNELIKQKIQELSFSK